MTCPDEVTIAALVGEAIEEHERAGMEAHLEECSSCRHLVAELLRQGTVDQRQVHPRAAGSQAVALDAAGDGDGHGSGLADLGSDVTAGGRESEPAGDSVSMGDFEPARPAFSAGDLLAGRYRIVRLLGRGGMGVVYEAVDLEIGERVALKTLLGGNACDPRCVARLKRELRLARKVTSPNVCRLFDFGIDPPPPGGRGPGISFLTMEFLAGETLAARLRRTGAIARAEAIELARQMVAALAAAHEAGVVHGDFKSANVMLVPQADKPHQVRAVVTDFGLARGMAAPLRTGGDSTLPGTGLVGSPAYMSPEQVEGRRP